MRSCIGAGPSGDQPKRSLPILRFARSARHSSNQLASSSTCLRVTAISRPAHPAGSFTATWNGVEPFANCSFRKAYAMTRSVPPSGESAATASASVPVRAAPDTVTDSRRMPLKRADSRATWKLTEGSPSKKVSGPER